ncbi:MAG: hypothetical protein COZ18_05085 [Flexibacter sp. CG_4_10_14_3_um_filter_32_15]|nr:MAG: hypothetical protein COZ18_05085 [Flexibacter sp. CG_4_10_14_3_um_filter_32_15]
MIQERKYNLIQQIVLLQNERLLAQLEAQINQQRLWDKAVRPMKTEISVEDLIKEQNYKPISKKSFFEQANAIQITESLDELLEMLD